MYIYIYCSKCTELDIITVHIDMLYSKYIFVKCTIPLDITMVHMAMFLSHVYFSHVEVINLEIFTFQKI